MKTKPFHLFSRKVTCGLALAAVLYGLFGAAILNAQVAAPVTHPPNPSVGDKAGVASPYNPAKQGSANAVAPPAGAEAVDGKKTYVPPVMGVKEQPSNNVILPPLYGWNRIVIKDIEMPSDQKVVQDCGMDKDAIFHFFVERIREGGIPLLSEEQASHLVSDGITVEAHPSIVSQEDLVINCISWVQFQVFMDYTFHVPPMMNKRKVRLMLWQDGTMITSAKSTHNGALINAFIDLAYRFRDGWDKQHAIVDEQTKNYTNGATK